MVRGAPDRGGPGCQTPTEMIQAFKLGAPIQKLFPGVMGGPN